MARSLQISFSVGGITRVVGAFEKGATAAEKYAASLDKVSASVAALGALDLQLPALPAASVRAPAAAKGPASLTDKIRGPHQRLLQEEAALEAAIAEGNEARINDARLAVERTRRQLEREANRGKPPAKGPAAREPAADDPGTAIVRREPKPERLPLGPAGQLRREEERLARAEAGDDPAELFDAQHRVRVARLRVARAQDHLQPDTFEKRLSDLVGSTRLNFGGPGGIGASPLVNRLEKAFPALAGAAAQLVGPLALGAVGVNLLGEAARAAAATVGQAAASVRDFTAARTLSGGTTGQIANLTAAGLAPGGIAGLAEQLRQKISLGTADPFALQAAQKIGLGPTLDRNLGPVNEAQFLERAVEGLRKLGAGEEQLYVARQLGLESILDTINVSDKVRAGQKRDAALRRELYDPATQANVRDLTAELTRFQGQTENMKVAFAKPFLPALVDGAATLSDAALGAAYAVADLSKWLSGLGPAIATLPGIGAALALFDTAAQTGRERAPAPESPEVRATRENTEALKAMSRQMGRIIGGGDRARSALPSGLRGHDLNQAAAGGSLRSGWPL